MTQHPASPIEKLRGLIEFYVEWYGLTPQTAIHHIKSDLKTIALFQVANPPAVGK